MATLFDPIIWAQMAEENAGSGKLVIQKRYHRDIKTILASHV